MANPCDLTALCNGDNISTVQLLLHLIGLVIQSVHHRTWRQKGGKVMMVTKYEITMMTSCHDL